MIRVGPAGWSYPDWEGIVYPRRKPAGFHALRHLARYFECVEINSSFYGTPSARNSEHWAALVADRPRFRFTAKLQQIFTHEPLTRDAQRLGAQVRAFHEGLAPLAAARKLAALLVQFPRSFARSAQGEERLAWIAQHFGGWPLALELRQRSWFEPEALARVRALGYTLCAIDLPAAADQPGQAELAVAGPHPLAYLRLHGRNERAWFDPRAGRDQKYDYLYGADELREVVQTARRLAQGADETFVITNNHFAGKAVANGLDLLAALGEQTVLGPVELLEAYPALRARVRPDGQDSLFAP